MSRIYLEILDKKREEIFAKLSSFKDYGYLAGGTALALQIKHRKSLDFDVFVKKPITNYFKLKAKKIFGRIDFYVNTEDQISFRTKDDISVTFVWYYFQPLHPPTKTLSIGLASPYDIAADKAYTIGRRAAWRDFVDLFFLLKKSGIAIEKIIKLAKKKFSGEFNEALFLEQLSYFKDLDVGPIEFLREVYTPAQIRRFLEREVRAYVKKRLGS